jgi:hypothetical protein
MADISSIAGAAAAGTASAANAATSPNVSVPVLASVQNLEVDVVNRLFSTLGLGSGISTSA